MNLSYRAFSLLVSWAIVVLLASAPTVLAQKSTTAITGHVFDQDGAVLAGADVRLVEASTGFTRQANADENGAFRFETLLIGSYELVGSAQGFGTTSRKLNLNENYTRNFDLTLQPEGASEVVNVTSASEAFTADVTSTGTKMELPIRDIPQSIQVVTRKLLDEQQAITIADAVRNVSGVTQAPTFFGHADHFVIRGFELDLANSYFRDGFKYDQLGFQETADVEQVEVLKGPASVLYGRSEPGGIVNITSKTPLQHHYFALELEGGSFNHYRGTFDASGPLLKNKNLLYRLNGVYQDSDHFRDFVYSERKYIAPQLLWRIAERTNVTFDGAFLREIGNTDFGTVGEGDRPADLPWRIYLNEPWGKYKYQSRQGGYIFNHVFNDQWSVRNALRYTSFNWYYYDTYQSYFLEPNQLVRYIEDWDYPRRNFSSQTDVQGGAKFFGVEHKLLFGFEYARNSNIGKGKYAELPPIDIHDFEYLSATPPPVDLYLNPNASFYDEVDGSTFYRTFGGYVQDQITFHPKLKALVGMRIDDYQSHAIDDSFAYGITDIEQDDSAVSPRLGAVYQPTDSLSFYFSFAKSFSPSYPTVQNIQSEPFEPTIGTQYEGGLKTDLANGRVTGTMSIYRVTLSNIITTDPLDPRNSVQIGEQRARGAEADFWIKAATNWNVSVAYAFNDAIVSKDTIYLVGSDIPNAARHLASIWTEYSFRDGRFRGLSVNGGISGQSRRVSALTGNTPDVTAGYPPVVLIGFTRTDIGASYEFDATDHVSYRFQFNVKNLFDERYYESGRSNFLIMSAFPRTYQASIQFSFK
ncbi:MAG: TonB-dependent receptor [Acidobacteria bacterium]|nr:TonB-dependent receptor [Acidobacteriota bacterium]